MSFASIIVGFVFVFVWLQLSLVAIEEFPEWEEWQAIMFALGVLTAVVAISMTTGVFLTYIGGH